MFVITANLIKTSQPFDLWFGASRRSAERAIARIQTKLRGVYADFQIVEREHPQ